MRILYTILFSALCLSLQSQMIVDTSYTVEEMVMDFFDSDNVIVSNVESQGISTSIGFFDADSSGFPINAGIVMSSGNILDIPGVESKLASTGSGLEEDEDLDMISGFYGTYDASFVQFDFMVMEDDSVNFTYVFASEEYITYVGSAFNDAFGFILSGPNYNGGFSNGGTNIALLPDDTTAVSINTVNHLDNTEYFILNDTIMVVFNGLTTDLNANFLAKAGETYNIKIVLGDVGDAILDSGVFLGFNSLGNPDSLVPPAEFEFVQNGNIIEFSNLSKYAREFHWDFGNGMTSTERYPEPLSYDEPGDYTIQLITENYCCSDTFSTQLNVSSQLISNIEVEYHVSCFEGNDGSIDLNIFGGVEPYIVTWSPEITNYNMISAGTYTYIITDADSTQVSGEIIINQPEEITYEVVTSSTIENQSDGMISITTNGGVAPYEYEWSNGETGEMITNLISGLYFVTITDANGCQKVSDNIFVESIPQLDMIVEIINHVSCFGANDGHISVSTIGGVPPYSITSNPPIGDNENLAPGTYEITVSDASGQITSSTFEITEPEELIGEINKTDSNVGEDNGTAEIIPSGGTEPYSFEWSNGHTTSSIKNLAPGLYIITVTDANGCEFISEVTIDELVANSSIESKIIRAYPNPVSDIFHVEVIEYQIISEITSISTSGQETTLSWTADKNKVLIETQKLASGTYILQIVFDNGNYQTLNFQKQ